MSKRRKQAGRTMLCTCGRLYKLSANNMAHKCGSCRRGKKA